ncbi:universal stress protein [Bremerella sp. T1]|uniref:universal stress protein n=1 Tax=Bremerella sp. TYQ1 TaxID=3119568 RepID=UPI001CCF5066|nr:universal stress protein [Bremerella volcania]UBM34456.1 universal stress protein [Bremerella volcania]
MIRSALIALDNSPSSQTALEMAISFCQRYAARNEGRIDAIHLSGVAVVDIPGIKAPTSLPIGAGAYKKQRDETLIKEAQERTDEILQYFEARCNEVGIPHTAIRSEGLPYEQIERQALSHDVILIGRDTNFHYETSEDVGATVRKLLVDNARPVVVYPQQMPDNHRVVIAYDGSNPAAHALQMWTLLEIRGPQTEIHVVSISGEEAKAQARLTEAAKFLEFHGLSAQLHYVPKERRVVEMLAEKVKELSPRMVVLGAYGRGGFKETLFGSSTNQMLETANCPLFLYK